MGLLEQDVRVAFICDEMKCLQLIEQGEAPVALPLEGTT